MVQFKVGLVAAACLGLFFAGAMCATTDHFNPVGSALAKNGGGNGGATAMAVETGTTVEAMASRPTAAIL